MSHRIKGKAFVLGENIDTDQIIPAEHLVYSLEKSDEKVLYGKYALSGVPERESGLPGGGIPFTPPNAFETEFQVIVAGKNFGCGSSREHAPAALQIAGARAVVAPSYARIFYRNAVDGGFIIPLESEVDLSKEISTGDEVEVDQVRGILKNLSSDRQFRLKPLGDVADIISAGGIFGYARKNGMME